MRLSARCFWRATLGFVAAEDRCATLRDGLEHPALCRRRHRTIAGQVVRSILADQATGWVKPLVMLAGGVINGGSEADVDYIMTH